MRRLFAAIPVVVGLAVTTAPAALGGTPLYPDMRTVMPQHVQLVNAGQQEILRFSNGIANTGAGPWALRPEPSIEEARAQGLDEVQAWQEFRDSNAYYECGTQPKNTAECFNVMGEFLAGSFVFHPAHNHWHISDVALFEVRKGDPYTGRIVGGNSIKTTFCLIDWYRLLSNSPSWERAFFDCYSSYQGIASGWVDQYHQSTSGQQLDLTGVPNGSDYYLVSTANYARTFYETDYRNNTAWVKFRLYTDSNGNRKVEVTGQSPCEPNTGLCGEGTTNR